MEPFRLNMSIQKPIISPTKAKTNTENTQNAAIEAQEVQEDEHSLPLAENEMRALDTGIYPTRRSHLTAYDFERPRQLSINHASGILKSDNRADEAIIGRL
jgi:hypothetical protein